MLGIGLSVCFPNWEMIWATVRIVARKSLRHYADRHPGTKASLGYWEKIVSAADWSSMNDVMKSFPKAKVINSERVRFELQSNVHRMVCSIYFPHRTVWIKFLGTHKEYDVIADITKVDLY